MYLCFGFECETEMYSGFARWTFGDRVEGRRQPCVHDRPSRDCILWISSSLKEEETLNLSSVDMQE